MDAIIANIPETLLIRTRDEELVEVSSTFIRESGFLKNELHHNPNPNPGEIVVTVRSVALRNAITMIEMCDTSTPYVRLISDDDLRAYMQTIPQITEFIQSLHAFHVLDFHNLSYVLEMDRLKDFFTGFLLRRCTRENMHVIVSCMHTFRRLTQGNAAEAA
uniref:BTB domain-containing protein n=1 Tax=Panagrellus redivivus TaxID=6233 RepID=A0A7E4VVM0_PANRE